MLVVVVEGSIQERGIPEREGPLPTDLSHGTFNVSPPP